MNCHDNKVEFSVKGNYALFSDIVTRAGGEKTSYDIPTYEALKGILKSVYSKPTFTWYIDSVRVMNQIKTLRKGVRLVKYSEKEKDIAYNTYLCDVEYQVKAHFEWNLNQPKLEADRNYRKHLEIAKRAIDRGGRFNVFIGTSECYGYVEPCKFGEGHGFYDESGEIKYGLMYHGITYPDEAVLDEDKGKMTKRFWAATMKNGIIEFISPEECTIKEHVRDMNIKIFGKEENNIELGE